METFDFSMTHSVHVYEQFRCEFTGAMNPYVPLIFIFYFQYVKLK